MINYNVLRCQEKSLCSFVQLKMTYRSKHRRNAVKPIGKAGEMEKSGKPKAYLKVDTLNPKILQIQDTQGRLKGFIRKDSLTLY